MKFLIYFFIILNTCLSWADCMAPLGVQGQFAYFSGIFEMQVCDGTNWLTLNNGPTTGAENNVAGCLLADTTNGQLVYNTSIYKSCYFNAAYGAFKMKSGNAMVVAPTGVTAQTGMLYFDPNYDEPMFYNGSSWFRMRLNPVILTTPGTYTFVTPKVQSSLIIKAWGGGGGGGQRTSGGICGNACTAGIAGTSSTITGSGFTTLTAGGGGAGNSGNNCANNGTGGATSGGGAGSAAGSNGAAPNGGNAGTGGGAGGNGAGVSGSAPGGGGAGNTYGCLGTYYGSGGGGGAYTTRTYAPGGITPGTILTVVVGSGGGGSTGAGAGGAGRVEISWD